MDITYTPYIDPDLEVLIERIHPPRVCVDNDSYPDCTLVKVDSTNKHGKLLEMVQVLTDLDLVISKSYISSDVDMSSGPGWVGPDQARIGPPLKRAVFHVTDQQGHKLTDEGLIDYIQEASSDDAKPTIRQEVRPRHVSAEHMALEMTGVDRPGLMSEMSAVLAELGCHVTAAVAWTHNGRAACIIYVEDSTAAKTGPIMDPCRVAEVQAQLENVVEAHHHEDERRSVRLAAPAPGQTHTERRLHQLLAADRDYEECCSCCGGNSEGDDFYVYGGCHKGQKKGCDGTHVKIENCRENGYSIINIRSRDRPKLLFDTVCVLTDLQYVVHHAAISSHGSIAFQEYYVRHKNGQTMYSEGERRLVTKCLIAATERRASHVWQNVTPVTLEAIRQEIGGDIMVEDKSLGASPIVSPARSSSSSSTGVDERPRFSLGNLLWAQLERLSSNFRPIKS
ncbi:hypothetical protein DH2020_016064 [Rehmannia glutinosa]|uniref:ACT domain-containing protein ACR n=1 Tax=Rehmannia glutinosa TaxID=99300 RepID=A0ABR0WUJ5_REHGL